MLKKEYSPNQSGMVIIMSEISIQAASAKTTLLDIAKQAKALADGLQNAAPGDKKGTPNNSIQYLLAISEFLASQAQACDNLIQKSVNRTPGENGPKSGI